MSSKKSKDGKKSPKKEEKYATLAAAERASEERSLTPSRSSAESGKGNGALDEVTVEVYETRLKDMSEKLNRAKDKCKALQSDNEALLKAQTKSVSEKQDIVEFLRIELANHEKNLALVEERLQQVEQENQMLVHSHATDMDAINSKIHEEREAMTVRLNKLLAELSELGEFRGKKGAMEEGLQSLVTEFENREREHKIELNTMERKFLQDKHQLRKDMILRVNDAVASFRQVADNQMAETTKRAIRENLVITSQLRKMSIKTVELIAENQELRTTNLKLKRDNSISNEALTELARKSKTNEMTVRKLLKKLKDHGYEYRIDEKGPLPSLIEVQKSSLSKEMHLSVDDQQQQQTPSQSPIHGVSHIPLAVNKELNVLREENTQLQSYAERTHNLLTMLCEQLVITYKDNNTLQSKNMNKIISEDFMYHPARLFINDLKAYRASIALHYPTTPLSIHRHPDKTTLSNGVDGNTNFPHTIDVHEHSTEDHGRRIYRSQKKETTISPKDASTRPPKITLEATLPPLPTSEFKNL